MVMDEKQVTPQEFNSFCELFATRHPSIEEGFKKQPLILIDGVIIRYQPGKMSNDEYDIFMRFLKRWYMANGYMEFEPDLVFVATDDMKAMAIDTDTIKTIEPVTLELTNVTIQEKNSDIIESLIIKENFEVFRKRAYIF